MMFDADHNADQRRGSQRGSIMSTTFRCCAMQCKVDLRSDRRAGSATGSAFKGFTLVEVIVAAGIFFILLMVITGVYTRFTFIQRREIGEQLLQEEVRFSLELVEREIRNGWGSTFNVVGPAPRPESQLLFRNQNGQCVSYRLQDSALERAQRRWEDNPDGECDPGPFTSASSAVDWERVTSSELVVPNIRFIPEKASASGDVLESQGFVTIIISFRSPRSGTIPEIHLQSTVTSRNMIPYKREIYE